MAGFLRSRKGWCLLGLLLPWLSERAVKAELCGSCAGQGSDGPAELTGAVV